MRWDRFFEDLEDQLDSEWEAERAALDSEAERLRLSRLGLRERLQTVSRAPQTRVGLELNDGSALTGTLSSVGADWAALATPDVAGHVILPLNAIGTIRLSDAELLHSARAEAAGPRDVAERMTFGYVLRGLARRRVPTTIHLVTGRAIVGTIDRALADHLDLALHDLGVPRRADAVTGVRILAFEAISWVRVEDATGLDHGF